MKKYYKKNTQKRIYQGVLQGNQRGFAFVICEGCKDLFVPHRSLNGAQHGDKVNARIVKGDEAEIVSVVKRGILTMTGRVEKAKGKVFVVPDNDNYYTDIAITNPSSKLRDNNKVIVTIKDFDYLGRPQGEIKEVLGMRGESNAETLSILFDNGFYDRFSNRVNKEAESLQKATDYTTRKDYRHLQTITIDGEDAKDFDDAISIEKTDNGYKLYVHIADVSHFVPIGSEIDKEAYRRGTSVYFPGIAYPMLPERISNDLCSLNPNEDKLTLTAEMSFDESGNQTHIALHESVITSKYRMTYSNIQKIIQSDVATIEHYPNLVEFVQTAKQLAEKIKKIRENRGSIDFLSQEIQIVLDKSQKDKDKVVEIKEREYLESNRIIEEFMIAANEGVASLLEKHKYPCIYRTHEPPKEEKILALEEYARSLGITPQGKYLKASEVSAFIKRCQATEYAKLISDVAIRSMQKAEYRTDNIGHFGLASICYCHFTSPIRRYPDLVVHRMVKLLAKGITDKQLEEIDYKNIKIAAHCSQMERAAERAEREVLDYYKTLYMSEHIGEEHNGLISGVTSFALFVSLDNGIEGYIPYESLPRDAYDYDPKKYTLRGRRNSYKLGDSVRIRVVDTNIYTRKILFALCAS